VRYLVAARPTVETVLVPPQDAGLSERQAVLGRCSARVEPEIFDLAGEGLLAVAHPRRSKMPPVNRLRRGVSLSARWFVPVLVEESADARERCSPEAPLEEPPLRASRRGDAPPSRAHLGLRHALGPALPEKLRSLGAQVPVRSSARQTGPLAQPRTVPLWHWGGQEASLPAASPLDAALISPPP
jgi:hypothetical protein